MLLQFYEENSHMKKDKVYLALVLSYYWSDGLFKKCDKYKERNILHNDAPLLAIDISCFAFQKISLNFSVPYLLILAENRYMLPWIDLQCDLSVSLWCHTVAAIISLAIPLHLQ